MAEGEPPELCRVWCMLFQALKHGVPTRVHLFSPLLDSQKSLLGRPVPAVEGVHTLPPQPPGRGGGSALHFCVILTHHSALKLLTYVSIFLPGSSAQRLWSLLCVTPPSLLLVHPLLLQHLTSNECLLCVC